MNNITINNKTIVIDNISKYNISFKDNKLILCYRDNTYISKKELFQQDLKYSILKKACIYENEYKNIKYKSFLLKLYDYISQEVDSKTLIENSTMNITEEQRTDSGYTYYPKLKVSIQGKDTNKTLKEIVHTSETYNIQLTLEILLKNKKVIRYRN